MKSITLSMFFGLFLYSTASHAVSENAVVCENCNYQQAKALAMKNAMPQLHCQIADGGEVIDIDNKSCYSDAKKIVVFNATTRAAFPFEVYHSNQGANPHDMVIQARERNLAPQIIELLNVGVDMQTNLNNSVDELATAAISKFQQVAVSSGNIASTLSASSIAADGDACSSDRDSIALEKALNPRVRASLQQYVQEIHRDQIAHTLDAFMSYFQRDTASLSTESFNFSKGAYGVNAVFDIKPKTTHFTAIYNTVSDVHFYTTKGKNGWIGYPQLVYNIGANVDGSLVVKIDDEASFIDGKALADIRNYQNSSEAVEVNPCIGLMLQQLNPNIQFDTPIPVDGGDRGGAGGNGRGIDVGSSWCTVYGKVDGKIVLIMRVMC